MTPLTLVSSWFSSAVHMLLVQACFPALLGALAGVVAVCLPLLPPLTFVPT